MQLPDRSQGRRRAVVRERAFAPQLVYQQPAQRGDFFETVRKLWRNRGIIAAAFLSSVLMSLAIAIALPSHYVGQARVLVGVPEPHVLKIESVVADINPDAERVQNESFVIQSRGLASEVIDQLHLANDPRFNPYLQQKSSPKLSLASLASLLPESWRDHLGLTPPRPAPADAAAEAERRRNTLIDLLLSRLTVTPLGRSHVLNIEAEASTPSLAASIANAFANLYLAEQRNDKIKTTKEVEDFLQGRIAELRQQVEKAEQAVADYQHQYGLYSGATTGVTSQQLTELNSQLILAQTAKEEADARVREAGALRRGTVNGDSVPEVLRSPIIQNLKAQQAQAERRLAELSASYGDRHPKIINARAEIADIKRKIQVEVAGVIGGLRHEARTADARYQALRQAFEHSKSQMGVVNEKTIHLEALRRDATVSRNLLEAMLSRAKETIGQQEIEQANAKLISPAAPPAAPGFPPKTLIAFLIILGGTLVGVLAALMRESLDRTFRRGDQIESATGLPVLAMVPNLGSTVSPMGHVLKKPVSPYSEALRKLYIGLELSDPASSAKTVLFCSATPGEGKSVLVASLGRVLACNGRRVLLIDCDWRCPSLHRLFRCSNRGGLASLLGDDKISLKDIVFSDALSGLDVIPAGELTPRSMQMLTSERMRIILQAFAKNYDLVILDTPPVLVGAEVLAFSRMVDKVVFAVRWGKTRREVALDALKQLLEAQADVAGVVLSRVDAKRYRQYAYGNLSYEYVRPTTLARVE